MKKDKQKQNKQNAKRTNRITNRETCKRATEKGDFGKV